MENVRDSPGSISVLSVIGRHNIKSKSGNTLYIHEPNQKTLGVYSSEKVKIVTIQIHCPTFRESGEIIPSEIQYEIFPPRFITDPRKDTREIVEDFRDATRRVVGKEHKHGVKVRSWKAQQARRTSKKIRDTIVHSQPKTTSEY